MNNTGFFYVESEIYDSNFVDGYAKVKAHMAKHPEADVMDVIKQTFSNEHLLEFSTYLIANMISNETH